DRHRPGAPAGNRATRRPERDRQRRHRPRLHRRPRPRFRVALRVLGRHHPRPRLPRRRPRRPRLLRRPLARTGRRRSSDRRLRRRSRGRPGGPGQGRRFPPHAPPRRRHRRPRPRRVGNGADLLLPTPRLGTLDRPDVRPARRSDRHGDGLAHSAHAAARSDRALGSPTAL
ncbi:MAG: hypothetical protein AVDCRST_MAG73-2086, partial [uncultured Thermomicrobiales bacterium]